MNDSDILSKLTRRSVRWLRKNFFDGKLIDSSKFSVCELIDDKSRENLLKPCFDGLSEDEKKELAKRLWLFPENKRKTVLFFVKRNDQLSQKFRVSVIDRIPNFEVIEETYLFQEPEMTPVEIEQCMVGIANGVSALFYLCENENTKFNFDSIKVAMAFVVGSVGKKNAGIICDCQYANIKTFADSLGVDCASSEELGINVKEIK